jgi:hypothetical protein
MFKGVTYLTDEQYAQLVVDKTLTVGDVTIEYDENMLYVTPDNIEYLKTSGGVITGDLTINGNITQQGNTYITHAEQVYSKNDYIRLRDGNTGGLAEGEFSGFEFNNYDSEGHSGRLVVDKNGVARVGDVGDEQPLATREERPIAGGFAKWDSSTNKFITDIDVATKTELSNYVALTGDQTIGGVKSFENEIRVVGPGNWEGIAIHNSNYALGDTLTTQMPLGRWITYDKNGTLYASVLQTVANTNNVNSTSIASLQKNTDGSVSSAQLALWAVKDGAPQVRATGHLLPASDSRFHIGSDTLKWQNIYLAGDIEAHSPNTRVFAIKNTDVSLFENPTSNTLLGGIKIRSKENAYLTSEETWRLANGGVKWLVGLRNNTGTVTGASDNTDIYKTMLTAELHKDGTSGLYTNTPDASSNSTQIATTAWVNDKLEDLQNDVQTTIIYDGTVGTRVKTFTLDGFSVGPGEKLGFYIIGHSPGTDWIRMSVDTEKGTMLYSSGGFTYIVNSMSALQTDSSVDWKIAYVQDYMYIKGEIIADNTALMNCISAGVDYMTSGNAATMSTMAFGQCILNQSSPITSISFTHPRDWLEATRFVVYKKSKAV